MSASREAAMAAAKEFVNFVNKCPSPYHVVEECRSRLLAAGFLELKETEKWNVKPNDKCFVARNQSSIIAFAVGGKYQPGNGISMVGAHTDSPCLKVKPVSKRVKHGFIQVGVECYGGGTWSTWFDRDLKLAGRVMVREGATINHRLVHVDRPILRVPNLAIHLNRELGTKFEWNKESNIVPVLATCVEEELQTGSKSSGDVCDAKCQAEKHHPVLVKLLSEELKVKPEEILDFELCLADFNPAAIGGVFNEFIFAARLDNLHSSYCALEALIGSSPDSRLQTDSSVNMINLYDNEEVGSTSAQGANSTWTELITRRLIAGMQGATPTSFEETMPQSLMLSCDVSHALHPNYADKHEDQHKPQFHKGPVIKFNANQRYATTAITVTFIRECAAKVGVPLQDFVVKNDCVCGSTIGPMISAKLGIPTVDLGAPLVSMHSIREMMDVSSVKQTTDLFKAVFEHYPSVYSSVTNI